MDENFRAKLRRILRIYQFLWGCILLGMIGLVILVFIFKNLGVFTEPAVSDVQMLDNVTFIIAILLVFLIFYLKRNYLSPKKMIERAENRDINIGSGEVANFVQEFGKEADLLAKILIIMRRYYMIIWSIADLIVLIGFLVYILGLQFQTFLIYSVIGLYSMAVNFPRFSIIERCYYRIANR